MQIWVQLFADRLIRYKETLRIIILDSVQERGLASFPSTWTVNPTNNAQHLLFRKTMTDNTEFVTSWIHFVL